MNLLAIESATDTVGAAVVRDGGVRVERAHAGGRAHAELLIPTIEEVCASSGCTIREIGHVAVDAGPGLFTGLRVGVATAKALAQALQIEVSAVSSLDALAAASAALVAGRAAGTPVPAVVAVVDARRGQVFASAYRYDRTAPAVGPVTADGITGDDGELVVDPASIRDDRLEPIDPGELLDWLGDLAAETSVAVVGTGAARYRDLLSSCPGVDLELVEEVRSPSPLVIATLARARLASGGTPLAPVELVPDYRRPADARINWEQRAPVPPGT